MNIADTLRKSAVLLASTSLSLPHYYIRTHTPRFLSKRQHVPVSDRPQMRTLSATLLYTVIAPPQRWLLLSKNLKKLHSVRIYRNIADKVMAVSNRLTILMRLEIVTSRISIEI